MNIETDAIDALGASLKIADDALNVFEELGKIPKQIPVLGTLAGLSEVLSAGFDLGGGAEDIEVIKGISDALAGTCTIIAGLAKSTASVTGPLGLLFQGISLVTKIVNGDFTNGLDIASVVLEGLGIIASITGLVLASTVGAVPAAIAAVVASVLAFASIIVDNWSGIYEFFSGIWTSISEGFSACWGAIVLFFTETIQPIVQSVMDAFSVFGEFLSGIWQSVGEFFATCWDAIVLFFTETLPATLETAVNFFAELPGKIWEFLSQAVAKLGEWALGLISKAGEVLPGVISSVVGFFSGLPGKMLEVGKNLVQGIWNGISNAAEWVLEKIKGFGATIVNGIKSIFGIHSPSAIMRDEVGKNLALGVAEGITKNKDAVRDAMSEMADVVADSDISVEPEVTAKSIDFEAFKEKIRPSLDYIKSQISMVQDTMTAQFSASAQLVAARTCATMESVYNKTTNFNNNYNITAANNSPKATADAIKNQMTMQRMLFATR